MKKSEIYTVAMETVVDRVNLRARDKLAIIEQLLMDRSLAMWQEEQEEKA